MATVNRALGSRVRAVRRREGLTQVQLAERLGISPSYLNLIEHGNRALPAGLLIDLARQLKLDLVSFAPDAEVQLEAEVREALADPLFDEHGLVGADVKDLVTGHPLIARALVTLYHSYRRDRADDDGPRAAHVSTEEVTSFIQRRWNWFPELEAAASELWSAGNLDLRDLDGGLARWLKDAARVQVRAEPPRGQPFTRRFDPERRVLVLSDALPARRRAFELAHTIALLQHEALTDAAVGDERLTTDESRTLARIVLANWFAGAVLLPYDPLYRAAVEFRYDVELLAHRFGASWEQVCHRLTSLRKPGMEAVPFHLIRVDVAGNISKQFSGSGIGFPRFSGVCARWNVFQAFQTPGLVRTQLSEMPDGSRFFCFACTVRRDAGGFHAPPVLHAIGLGCRVERGRELVYADGMNLDAAESTAIGVTCRTCPRTDCAQRVCPPIDQPLTLDPNVRGVSLFAR